MKYKVIGNERLDKSPDKVKLLPYPKFPPLGVLPKLSLPVLLTDTLLAPSATKPTS